MKRVVEIVCCSVKDCVLATQAGADRIELCSAIELGGLTPSLGLLSESQTAVSKPIMVMLRPRPGGFGYSATEFNTMVADIEAFSTANKGQIGFVFGLLQPDGTIDRPWCKQLLGMAEEKDTVFHRAFDQVPSQSEALEILIDLGFTRILTSGHATSAVEGVDTIKRLIDQADGRIEIMPGGGVRSSNVAQILAAGCKSVHLAPCVQGENGAMEVDPKEVSTVAKLCR